MGHVLSVGTVFSTLEATGTLQSTRSPPVLLFLRSVFLSPSLRLVVSAYERNSGRGPTDEQLCSSSRERDRSFQIHGARYHVAGSTDCGRKPRTIRVNAGDGSSYSLDVFQVYFNEGGASRVEENGSKGREEEQFITGRIGGVTVIR